MELDDGDDVNVILGDGTEDTVPQDLITQDIIFNLMFHPTAPFLAVGLVSGAVEVHEFRRNETRPIASIPTHSGGVAGMEFTFSGTHLVTVSSDRHIKVLDCAAQQNVIDIKKKNNPHKVGVSSVSVCTENLVATGDDDGMVVLWDMRQQKSVLNYHEHGDHVSSLIYFAANEHLITSSGDTCVGAWDIRGNKIIEFSEPRKDELTSMIFMASTNDLVCGSPSGALPIWKYGAWRRPYDVYAKHPREADCLTPYNDNMFISGAYDGCARIIQHFPVRRVLTHLAGAEKRRRSISHLSVSHDRMLLAAAGHDKIIQFHDLEFLGSEEKLDLLRNRAERIHMATIKKATEQDAAEKKVVEEGGDSDEWTDDSDDDSDMSDDSDDSDDDAVADDAGDSDDDGIRGRRVFNRDDTEHLDRKTKRERMAASRWLKTAQKEKVNFKTEARRKRVKGFWSGLVSDD